LDTLARDALMAACFFQGFTLCHPARGAISSQVLRQCARTRQLPGHAARPHAPMQPLTPAHSHDAFATPAGRRLPTAIQRRRSGNTSGGEGTPPARARSPTSRASES